jgi:L-cystine uptake protein TcyP (sodium:dicarboxylate symporter family)
LAKQTLILRQTLEPVSDKMGALGYVGYSGGLVHGWNVWSAVFLVPLVIYIVIASIGTAGVGGGATIPFGIVPPRISGRSRVAILVSVDFIIDMGRTLINVSDSILAGYVTGKLEKDINEDLLYG